MTGPEARHLAVVLRAEPGMPVELFDGRGNRAAARVCAVGADWVDCEILERHTDPAEDLARTVTLATAVPKGERFDWLIEKATELGVTRVIPLVTARSVVNPGDSKLDRLRRTIVEASKQSGRTRLMELSDPQPWRAFLASRPLAGPFAIPPATSPSATSPASVPTPGDAPAGRESPASPDEPHPTPLLATGDRLFVAHPGGPRWTVPVSITQPVTLVIGPEGGLTDEEVAQAEARGAERVGLGRTILRIETAALALATLAIHGP